MDSTCRELPTIEECRSAAQAITHECLRLCVELQCAGIKVKCDQHVREKCKKELESGIVMLGYVYMNRTMNVESTCKNPKQEINWCEWKVSRECRAQGMVHELAHSCGWDHGEGLGVPGNSGSMQCD